MENEFWKQAWVEGKIGFHQSQYNSTMSNHYDDLQLKDKNVFIPLAGKSLDILYFLEKGANVTAVELSELACEEFFKENKFDDLQIEEQEDFTVYKTENLTYYCGDFFAINPEDVTPIDFYYDRACIVALPYEIRTSFYDKIDTLLSKHTDIFILTYSHEGPKTFGPPFYVPEEEIQKAYSLMGFDLEYIKYNDTNAQGRFKDAGLGKMTHIKWKRQI